MCLSLSLSPLVIVLLLTVISAETSAAGKNGSFAIKVSCIICSTLSGKRNLLQRRPFDREHRRTLRGGCTVIGVEIR